MAYIPDVCFHDAQFELLSEKQQIKHAALTLYGYYCRRRNKGSGLCSAKLERTHIDTGIPLSNVSQLKTFLDENGWIHDYGKNLIKPLKGFYTDEQIFFTRLRKLIERPFFVLIIRILFLKNRNGFLIIRNLFKGNLNQHLEPALLTREGATTSKRRSAPRTSPDKIFKNQPAGKPAPRSSADVPTNAAPAGKPADERRFHPAILMVKEISKRTPPKDIWDRIIREIKGDSKTEFFRDSFEKWRGFDGNPQNFEEWLFIPNKTGKPPQRFERNGHGNSSGKPVDVPKHEPLEAGKPFSEPIAFDERILKAHLVDFQVMNYSDSELSELEKSYAPEAWAWLMENLKN